MIPPPVPIYTADLHRTPRIYCQCAHVSRPISERFLEKINDDDGSFLSKTPMINPETLLHRLKNMVASFLELKLLLHQSHGTKPSDRIIKAQTLVQ